MPTTRTDESNQQRASIGEMTLSYQLKHQRELLESLQQRMWLLENDYKHVPSHVSSLERRDRKLRQYLAGFARACAASLREGTPLPESILDIPGAPSANETPPGAPIPH